MRIWLELAVKLSLNSMLEGFWMLGSETETTDRARRGSACSVHAGQTVSIQPEQTCLLGVMRSKPTGYHAFVWRKRGLLLAYALDDYQHHLPS
jgi:hypothetical protein